MSGGVDSSVALLRILEAGYEAVGVTMKLWEYDQVGGNIVQDTNCCSVETINGAKLVCDRLGVPHYTIDFTRIFKENVVDNFAEEYLNGRTPNPCVRCNSFVKWEAFFNQAKILNADLIATGHYARIDLAHDIPKLRKGLDPQKDQSYVLWGIPRHTLSRTLLPLGDLTKKEVRLIAREHQLETSDTPESMEICFVVDNDYKRFLNEYRPDEMAAIKPGEIFEDGNVVGIHEGYTHFTIGQRKGLGLSRPEPRYVRRIDSKKNRIYITRKDFLWDTNCLVSKVNWLVDIPALPINIEVQIRYNSTPVAAEISSENEFLRIKFAEPRLSVTPGQSIVFYEDDLVLGGGIIELDPELDS